MSVQGGKFEYKVPAATTEQVEDMRMLYALPTDSAARKTIPVATGVLDYFPAALAAVAELSRIGNDKHNPGQPLHWSRGKSSDHADCIVRHLLERGTIDTDGLSHSVKVAWRALALLQEELEAAGAPMARGAWVDSPMKDVPVPGVGLFDGPSWAKLKESEPELIRFAEQMVVGEPEPGTTDLAITEGGFTFIFIEEDGSVRNATPAEVEAYKKEWYRPTNVWPQRCEVCGGGMCKYAKGVAAKQV